MLSPLLLGRFSNGGIIRIVFAGPMDAPFEHLNETFQKLAAGRGPIRLDQLPFVRSRGEIELEARCVANPPFGLIRRPGVAVDAFIWRDSADNWDRWSGLLDGAIESPTPGHQYLARGVEPPSQVELSRGEEYLLSQLALPVDVGPVPAERSENSAPRREPAPEINPYQSPSEGPEPKPPVASPRVVWPRIVRPLALLGFSWGIYGAAFSIQSWPLTSESARGLVFGLICLAIVILGSEIMDPGRRPAFIATPFRLGIAAVTLILSSVFASAWGLTTLFNRRAAAPTWAELGQHFAIVATPVLAVALIIRLSLPSPSSAPAPEPDLKPRPRASPTRKRRPKR